MLGYELVLGRNMLVCMEVHGNSKVLDKGTTHTLVYGLEDMVIPSYEQVLSF